MAGAPIGNQNAANGKKWRAAIDRALDKTPRVAGLEALDQIAKVLIAKALAGEQWAIDMIGNRLDGKPAQSVEVAGPDGGPVQAKVTVEFVKDPAT